MTIKALLGAGSEHGHQSALFAYTAVATWHGWQVADFWANGLEIKAAIAKVPVHLRKPVLELKWFHAIPNGGSRGDSDVTRKIEGGKMKAEGVKSGIGDTFLPIPAEHFVNGKATMMHGLYIEMKRPSEKPVRKDSKGGLSDSQIEFKEHCIEHNYAWSVCYSWQEAVAELKRYIGLY